jgi:hypothetical protein
MICGYFVLGDDAAAESLEDGLRTADPDQAMMENADDICFVQPSSIDCAIGRRSMPTLSSSSSGNSFTMVIIIAADVKRPILSYTPMAAVLFLRNSLCSPADRNRRPHYPNRAAVNPVFTVD